MHPVLSCPRRINRTRTSHATLWTARSTARRPAVTTTLEKSCCLQALSYVVVVGLKLGGTGGTQIKWERKNGVVSSQKTGPGVVNPKHKTHSSASVCSRQAARKKACGFRMVSGSEHGGETCQGDDLVAKRPRGQHVKQLSHSKLTVRIRSNLT